MWIRINQQSTGLFPQILLFTHLCLVMSFMEMLFSEQPKGKGIVIWQMWKAKIQLPSFSGLDIDLLSPKPSIFKFLPEDLNMVRIREIIWFLSICYWRFLKQICFTW